MPSRNVGQEVQAEILKAARRGQEVFGHAIKSRADKLPKPEQLAENARELAAKLPKPEELAENARGLAAKLPKPEQVAGNVRGITSQLPKPERLSGRVRSITTRLPKPEHVAGNAVGLFGKLLASQRKFADQVLRVTSMSLGGKRGATKNSAAGDGPGGGKDTGAGDNDSQ
jgi:hypothetical protein